MSDQPSLEPGNSQEAEANQPVVQPEEERLNLKLLPDTTEQEPVSEPVEETLTHVKGVDDKQNAPGSSSGLEPEREEPSPMETRQVEEAPAAPEETTPQGFVSLATQLSSIPRKLEKHSSTFENRNPEEMPDKVIDNTSLETQAVPSSDQTPPRGTRTSTSQSLGQTPATMPPTSSPVSSSLPQRVNEIDTDATRVGPAAYQEPLRKPTPNSIPTRPRTLAETLLPPNDLKPRPKRGVNWRSGFGCLLRMAILGLFGLVLLLVAGGSFVLYEYYNIASTLPSVDDLRQRASQFETTRILDRNGNILYEILDPTAGRRTYVKLDKISPYLVAATIATEDKGFYTHPGFDPTAIVRAFWQNIQGGETVSGASTITQQLARALLLSPQERNERSYMRKVREALLAAEITRRYSKDEILELYLNENFYGNLAYGVEAASETYFGITADKLSLGQAAFLAGLPQAPSVYDVYTNRDATLHRMNDVLVLMIQASREQNCIYVSNNEQPVCVGEKEALSAFNEIVNHSFKTPEVMIRYPHWVNYVRSILESQYDAQTIYRSGFSVYTTLDPALQDQAEQIVKDQVAQLADKHATDGALVAIQPKTGEILAMVGSADYNNAAIHGQVNMATSPTRQPGSSIKPFTYLTAFEKGWTPATLIWDVPSEFPPSGDPNDNREPYKPTNYDGLFHGPVTVRTALANSYNIPAVKTLQFVGIYDNPNTSEPDGLINMLKRFGITTLTRDDYGLSLTLGGGEVSLLEFTGAYATLANGGMRIPPYAISKILDFNGNVVYQYQPPPGQQVIHSEHAYLITNILSDNEARTPAFGPNSVLNLPFPAAVKTGTTNNFRDNWTMGYTPDLAVGVWVGNADYSEMENTTGVTGAAPIWSDFMKFAEPEITGGNPTPFLRPAGIIDRVICELSGTEPSQWCPSQRSEIFAAYQPPLPREQDLWTKVTFDTWTGLRASEACNQYKKEDIALNVTDPWAIKWIQESDTGRKWAQDHGFGEKPLFVPQRECKADDPHPILEISAPGQDQTITASPLDIVGKVDASADFKSWQLDYGLGSDPVQWEPLTNGDQPIKDTNKLYSWDISQLPTGAITLRLTVFSTLQDRSAELKWHLNLQVPTPTPTATPTPTPTPTTTPTPVPTWTPLPSATPTVTLTPSPTSPPTPTPTSTTTSSN